ncbi:MAG: hypothetical protein K9I85_04440 [Saprospiraceae bacterium]|nr:hypothetical protein [Saprospiraceae bacterium]
MMKDLLPLTLLFFIGLSVFYSCQSSTTSSEEAAPIMDTVITEIRDTVITFYPETYEEVVQEVISYDTVISPRSKDTE